MNHTVTLTNEERLGLGHVALAWRNMGSNQLDSSMIELGETLLLVLGEPGTPVKLRTAPSVVNLAEMLAFEGEIGNLDTGQVFDNDAPPAVRQFWKAVAALALADVGSTLTIERAEELDDLGVIIPDDVSSLTKEA